MKLGEMVVDGMEIDDTCRGLGRTLGGFYASGGAGNREVMYLGIMNGALPFMADLMRWAWQFGVRGRMATLAVKSYAGTKTTGKVQVQMSGDLKELLDCKVVIVEDIIDTGLTIRKVVEVLRAVKIQKSNIRIVSLLGKDTDICTGTVEWLRKELGNRSQVLVGRWIPDKFVVGYGLDYDGLYRDMPHIMELEE